MAQEQDDIFAELGISPDEARSVAAQGGGDDDIFAELGLDVDYSRLSQFGLEDDERARELYTEYAQAQAAGDEQAARRSLVRLSGYASGRDAIDGQTGGESRAENIASRAESALRGVGQGVFGLGDFSAALGSWLGEGGPFSEFGIRDHFAFQRARREGMEAQNPVSSTAGYLGGAVTGGGAVQAGVRGAARSAPGMIGRAARFAQVAPRGANRSQIGNVARNAVGSGAAGATAAFAEEGTEGNIRDAAIAGAVAGPVGERVFQTGGSLLRRGARRIGPGHARRAATAEIARQAFDPENRIGTEAVDALSARVQQLGPDASLIEGIDNTRARVLGESMTQSDEAVREAIPNLDRIQTRRAERLSRGVQGGRAPRAADDIAEREAGLGRRATRRATQERDVAAEELEASRRNAVRAARAEGEEAMAAGRERVSEAERNLQARLQDATYADDMVDPEDIRRVATQYGNERMAEIAGRRFEIPEQTATDLLDTRSVRKFLRDYAEDNPDSRDLLDVLGIEPDEETGAFPAFSMTLRQVDSLRRAADAAGEARPEVRFRLTQLADDVEQLARRRVPEYDEFLTNFANLRARADGAEAGFRVRDAQPSRLEAEVSRLRSQNRTSEVGVRQASQRAIFDEATASPRAARRAAERIAEDPRNVQATMGPRAGRVRRLAEEGVEDIREAERALEELRIRQRADQEELDDLFFQRRNQQSREFDDRIAMIQDRVAGRQDAIRRAEDIVGGSTSNVVRGAQRAREEGLSGDFQDVARTRLAETAGESGQAATDVAESLRRDPGLRQRVNAVFGETEANRIFGLGGREARGAEATLEAAKGANVNLNRLKKDEQEMLLSAVDLGVLSTDRASGSFIASAAIRAYRLVNGDTARAIQLTRALTSGDPVATQNAIDRLAQLGASRELQFQLANAFGTGAALTQGREQAEED
jgi:hypothetical protein